MNNNILEVKNLKKIYHTKNGEINAIADISLEVRDGEFIAIVGSSGCGKSTLLSILAGLDKQSTGEIIFKCSNPIVGYMLQQDALFPWLTILENTLIGLEIKNLKNEESVNYVKKLLETYGLKDFMYKKPHELSGGMKQRVVCM